MSVTRRDDEFAGHRDGVVAGEWDRDVIMPLLESISSMIAHVLNNLDEEGRDEFVPCDPKECAPCQGLYRLHDLDLLDTLIRPYVRMSGAGWDWWLGSAETGRLNWDWVTARTWPGSQGIEDENDE
jgi:hypothetical protein